MWDKERREYFRLKENVSIKFREIDESEFGKVRERMVYNPKRLAFKNTHVQLSEGEKPKKTKGYEVLLFYFEVLNKKLDMILERMEEGKNGSSFVKSVFTLDISASGVRFISPKKPEKPYLELVILPPVAEIPEVRTIAEVVRVKEKKKECNEQWEVAARYMEILEDDRDLLVSYLISREREMIKKSKSDE